MVSKYTKKIVNFCSVDKVNNKIVIESTDPKLEGMHDLIVFASYADEDL